MCVADIFDGVRIELAGCVLLLFLLHLSTYAYSIRHLFASSCLRELFVGLFVALTPFVFLLSLLSIPASGDDLDGSDRPQRSSRTSPETALAVFIVHFALVQRNIP